MIAKQSDIVLNVKVKEEACPYDLVPTASTTAALVMGDALAIAVFQARGFSIEDFARYHPGGDIGRRLLLCVDDIMHTGNEIPMVSQKTSLPDTILEITSKRLGATCIMSKDDKLVGIITDGDLRRLIEKKRDIWNLKAEDVMTMNPKRIRSGVLAEEALLMLEKHGITQLIVTDENEYPIGIIHLHDILTAGIA